ncbi:CDP-6-deoxy-delta-3,4-glucoseen reductase [Chitinivorax sp. B]|uniref:CDP-6-deoxy-delta-3,4-glucoseen reductase n=1 Tax=Chitinivorax sp. B TaxID=2502235 RepID=UPI0010F91096|nr:CDP-6-deoxy-delta-3,4-glucoseen reductase [Chitinivorax sp. B]
MSCKVTVKPSGHEFIVNEGETILEAALRESIMLPYGCRNGACGACKGKVLEGTVTHSAYAEATLSNDERVKGIALFCCAKPQGDVVIESKEIGAAKDIQIKTLPCRVEKIEKISHNVAVLSLKLPANERLQFMAGQYIDIIMKDGKRRSFSMANAPHDDAFIQLHIRHMPGGTFSEYVWNTMKPKEIMRFQGPLGSFFLREDSDKPIIFVASGTGFAPVKGIVEHAIRHNIQRPMTLYWGAYNKSDIYMYDLPEQWARDYPHFKFVPVLSDPVPADNWHGRIGFVHAAVLDDVTDFSNYQVYACGAPVMVEAAHRGFTEKGLPEDEFYSDAFFLSKDLKPTGA